MNKTTDLANQESSNVIASIESRPSASFAFALKKFVVNAKSASSESNVVDVIKQAIESPSTFVFGELLDVTTVKSLKDTTAEPYLTLLNLYAYGTYEDYLRQKNEHPASLPELSPAMVKKLRQLSIVSLSRSRRYIQYQELLQKLGLDNIRQLEDIIIDIIYSNVIQGTMDQLNNRLEVDQTIGRDVRDEDFANITEALTGWCRNCDNILSNMEHQMSSANRVKDEYSIASTLLDGKIANIRKNNKNVSENEDVVMTDLAFGREPERNEKMKRNSSSKLMRTLPLYRGLNKSWRKDNN